MTSEQITTELKTKRAPINKGWLIGGAILLVVVIFGWLGINHMLPWQPKPIATSAGHRIYEEDAQELIGKTKDVTEKQAATVLADKYLSEAMADDENLTITKQDIIKAYGKDILDEKKTDEFTRQNAINQLYFQRLEANNTGIYKGKVLVSHFGRYVAYESPLLAEDKKMDPNIGNPKAIAVDKAVAIKKIEQWRKDIHSKKITFDQAIEREKNDPVVGEKAYPVSRHSSSFDTAIEPARLITTKSIKDKVDAMKVGELSEPMVARVSSSSTDDSTAETYFVIVQLDERSGGNSAKSFPEVLSEAKQELGYKINV